MTPWDVLGWMLVAVATFFFICFVIGGLNAAREQLRERRKKKQDLEALRKSWDGPTTINIHNEAPRMDDFPTRRHPSDDS